MLARHRRSGRSMAFELGWTQPYISRRLTGEVPFDVNDLAAIAAALGVSVISFFAMDDGARKRGFCSPEVTAVAA